MRGTAHKHDVTIGHIIVSPTRGAGTLCHDFEDPRQPVVLFGQPATLFESRAKAQRIIDACVKNGRYPAGELRPVRVAALAGKRGTWIANDCAIAVSLIELRQTSLEHSAALKDVISLLERGKTQAAVARLDGAVTALERAVRKDYHDIKIRLRAEEIAKGKGQGR